MYLKKDLASAGMQLGSLPELPEAAQDWSVGSWTSNS